MVVIAALVVKRAAIVYVVVNVVLPIVMRIKGTVAVVDRIIHLRINGYLTYYFRWKETWKGCGTHHHIVHDWMKSDWHVVAMRW